MTTLPAGIMTFSFLWHLAGTSWQSSATAQAAAQPATASFYANFTIHCTAHDTQAPADTRSFKVWKRASDFVSNLQGWVMLTDSLGPEQQTYQPEPWLVSHHDERSTCSTSCTGSPSCAYVQEVLHPDQGGSSSLATCIGNPCMPADVFCSDTCTHSSRHFTGSSTSYH